MNTELPPLPDIVAKVDAKLSNPGTSLVDVARVIETEPVLTGRILKLANSVHYGGGRIECKSLTLAIGRLGLKTVRKAVFSVAVSRLFRDATIIDQWQFWRHSLSVGYLARCFCKRKAGTPQDQEAAYLAGLMHEIGVMVFGFLIPDEYTDFLRTIDREGATLEYQEYDTFGIDHAELGAKFLEQAWQISSQVTSAVRKHHDIFHGVGRKPKIEHHVFLANCFCNEQEITNGIQVITESMDEKMYTSMGFYEDEKADFMIELEANIEQAELLLR